MNNETSKASPATDATEPAVSAAPAMKGTGGPRGGRTGGGGTKAARPAKKPTPAATKATGGKAAKAGKGTGKNTTPAKPRPTKKADGPRKARTGTKQERLIAMLKATDGATVDEIAKAFGWQAHTVRGALYGALKKKLGLDVVSEKVEGRGRVYRIGN